MGIGDRRSTPSPMMLFLWIIRRDTPPHRAGYIWGIRLGVAMFLLASLQGALIVANNAHSVPGPTAAPACRSSTGPPAPATCASPTSSACTRMQALPLLGFLLDRSRSAAGA